MHVFIQVAAFRGADHLRRAVHDLGALRGRGAPRRAGGDQLLQCAAGLDQVHVVRQLDHRHAQAPPGLLADQPGRHHAQQRLAQRRAPQAGLFHQIRFHDRAARLHLQRGAHALALVVGDIRGASLGFGSCHQLLFSFVLRHCV
ncbi:hypothetical protein G6F63_014672 [Rhizopus arrhizus]|nr:hypothetical protein G6F63_014672 [Rhizopus arrhizus]